MTTEVQEPDSAKFFCNKKTGTRFSTGRRYSPPRYLSALGKDPKNDLFISGGMAGQTGDQMLAPGTIMICSGSI